MNPKDEVKLHEVGKDDFKYILQDVGNIYVGACFSYEELLTHDMVPFKMKAIFTQYILKEVSADTSLESHFYYMVESLLAFNTYKELKIKIKAYLPEEYTTIFGKKKCKNIDKIFTLEELSKLTLAEKQRIHLCIREIIFSKMALLAFAV